MAGVDAASTPARRSDTLMPHGACGDRDCIAMPPGRQVSLLLEIRLAVYTTGERPAVGEFDGPEKARCGAVACDERRCGDRVARLDSAANRQRKPIPPQLRCSRHLELPILHC